MYKGGEVITVVCKPPPKFIKNQINRKIKTCLFFSSHFVHKFNHAGNFVVIGYYLFIQKSTEFQKHQQSGFKYKIICENPK